MKRTKDIEELPEYHESMSRFTAEKLGYLTDTEDSFSVSGKVLAELLGVNPATVSQAVQNKHRVKGYHIHNWATTNRNGRVKEYHIPANIYKELKGKTQFDSGRNNPDPETLQLDSNISDALSGLNGGSSPQIHAPTSLLPEGQDYHKSVGLAGGAYVMRNLLDTDKPQGKALTVALLSGGFAIGGKIFFETNSAGMAGGAIGLLIGLLYLESPFTKRLRDTQQQLSEPPQREIVHVHHEPEPAPTNGKPKSRFLGN